MKEYNQPGTVLGKTCGLKSLAHTRNRAPTLFPAHSKGLLIVPDQVDGSAERPLIGYVRSSESQDYVYLTVLVACAIIAPVRILSYMVSLEPILAFLSSAQEQR